MERLTYDFCIGGNHCWQVKGADNLECREICEQQEGEGCKSCPIAKAFDRLAAYEDTGLEPEEIEKLCDMDRRAKMAAMLRDEEKNGISTDRLRELVQADRDGRCVIYPAKIGDKLFQTGTKYQIYEYQVGTMYQNCRIVLFAHPILADGKLSTTYVSFDEKEIGKTVFLTREAAEEALKGENNEIK